jgi:hypothetical protein
LLKENGELCWIPPGVDRASRSSSEILLDFGLSHRQPFVEAPHVIGLGLHNLLLAFFLGKQLPLRFARRFPHPGDSD